MSEKINLSTAFSNQREMNFNELLQLLKRYGPKFWSWGAHAFQNIGNKALRMTVNGHHHKGHVYISVNGMDLYDVLLTSRQGTKVQEIKDLYFDQLFEAIDNRIERIAAYRD